MTSRYRRSIAGALALVVIVTLTASCDVGRAGTRCRSGVARNSTHVLLCVKGRWRAGPTLAEAARIILASRPAVPSEAPSLPAGPATSPPATSPPAPPIATLAQLAVAPEVVGGYERDLFQPSGWGDTDNDGCDTRSEVLMRDSRAPVTLTSGCRVGTGNWISIYDGFATNSASDLEIDHVVALAEAWRSGARDWSADRRHEFTDDMDNLVAVSVSSNRSKGDRDPALWQPPQPSSWCRFGAIWISVKVKWSLAADQREFDALGRMTQGC